MQRRLLIGSLMTAFFALLLGACEVRGEAAVEVTEDGSGLVLVSVELDAEASRRLGDPATALRTTDLAEAGWKVHPPGVVDGGLELRSERSFASPEDLAGVLTEMAGGGVFTDVHLSVEDGFARTDYRFSATVELTGNPEQFGDAALSELLGGLALARSPEELAMEGAADPRSMVLDVVVDLPGGAPRTNGEVVDGAARWSFPLTGGEATSERISSSSSMTSDRTRVLAIGGVVALVSAAVLALVGLLRRGR